MIRLLLVSLILGVVLGDSKHTESPQTEEEELSPLGHDEDLHHDHNAALGEDGEGNLDQLTPEEIVRRLGILLDRIDTNKDGFISQDELKIWIQNARRNYTREKVERQWKDYDTNGDDLISWDEYKNVTYGEFMGEPHAIEDFADNMLADERRFRAADTDGDSNANKHEFSAFLHPEIYRHMRDVLVQETMEDFDKDRDGFIDMNEFIDALYSAENKGEVPEWVEKEREQFSEIKDKNKDGKLDPKEMMEVIFPSGYNLAEAEAKQLLEHSDADKDGKLTKSEVLDKHEIYAESQVTNYGETLLRHDEF